VAHGGKGFPGPLPFALGINLDIYGGLATSLTQLAGVGMKYGRIEVPWNYAKGNAPAFESTPGTYSSSAITFIVSNVAAMASYGIKPLLLLSTNVNPGLASTWTSGVPVTPAQFGAAAGELVTMLAAQGLTGLHIELFNEPDGGAQGIPAALLVSAFQAAYPAMKSADSTCTVHFSPMEAFVNTSYFNSCSGAMAYCDVIDVHNYQFDATFTTYIGPYAVSGYNTGNYGQGLAGFKANMISNSINKPLWLTEVGWPNGSNTGCTPKSQAQWLQDLLVLLSGKDLTNNVAFSSYLAAVCLFGANNSGANWGIQGGTDDTSVAVPILTSVVRGY
jgi:hypothetical protein